VERVAQARCGLVDFFRRDHDCSLSIRASVSSAASTRPAVLGQQHRLLGGQRRAGGVLLGVPPDDLVPPQRRPAAVDYRGPQVRQRVGDGEGLPALMQPDEDVLDDILAGGPVADDERGEPDQVRPVCPERGGEAIVAKRARFHADHTNWADYWLLRRWGKLEPCQLR